MVYDWIVDEIPIYLDGGEALGLSLFECLNHLLGEVNVVIGGCEDGIYWIHLIRVDTKFALVPHVANEFR